MKTNSRAGPILLAALLALAASGCSEADGAAPEPQPTPTTAPTSSPSPPPSGVEAQVWIGPTCPVVRVGSECPDDPYETTLTVTDLEGEVVATGKSDAQGYYRIELPPGEYILVPARPRAHAPPFADSIPFEVKTGTFTQLDVHYDSGLR